MVIDNERNKAVDMALDQIHKDYGKGAIMRMSDSTKMQIEAISTGSLSIDAAIGIGGLPRGRIIEIYGPESSGKTTVSLHVVAECQKKGGVAAFIDAENSLDPVYAAKLGVKVDELLVSQPDYGEQALDICETLVRSGAIDVIVIDSVAALVPKSEIEGDMGDSHMGLQARLMSQALRKLAAIVNKSKTIVIFINQLRMKIGVVFGNPETTPGGRALKFYSSVRLDVRRIESIKNGVELTGNRVRVKVAKNKVAPPFKQAEVEIFFGEGISKEGDILELAVKNELIEKSGTWFSYAGARIGQGKESVRKYLRENPVVMEELDMKIREKLGMPVEKKKEEPASAEATAGRAKKEEKEPVEVKVKKVKKEEVKTSVPK